MTPRKGKWLGAVIGFIAGLIVCHIPAAIITGIIPIAGGVQLQLGILLNLAGAVGFSIYGANLGMERHRFMLHQCQQCGYTILGTCGDQCPECGHIYTEEQKRLRESPIYGLKRDA